MTSTSRSHLTAPELEEAPWTKSSYSGGNSGQCVEVADVTATHSGIAVRDSKDPKGPALMFGPAPFADFIAEVAAGRFDV